jgi:surface protein
MFNGCRSLVTLDLSNFNTNKATNMNWMFYNCSSLETLDMRNFDTSNITANMKDMFYNCTSLIILRLDNCSADTISDIISQSSFPTGTVNGWVRKIFCKRTEAEGLTAPENWEFSYID